MTTTESLAAWKPRSRARFWSRVERTETCWNWIGSLTVHGYGQYRHMVPGLTGRAHKLAWELENGPVPEGYVLDHLCRNRRCVRPEHLESVTPKVNALRGIGPTAVNARKSKCAHGHKLSGSRVCAACRAVIYDRRLARDMALRGSVTCAHPTRNGGTCTRKIAVGNRCCHHEVWNLTEVVL